MENIFYAVRPLPTCMSHSYNFLFKCCNLIFETVKTYNLTCHNYQYLICDGDDEIDDITDSDIYENSGEYPTDDQSSVGAAKMDDE